MIRNVILQCKLPADPLRTKTWKNAVHKESVSEGLEEVDKEKLQMAVVTQLARTQREIMPGKILAEAKNTHLFESREVRFNRDENS